MIFKALLFFLLLCSVCAKAPKESKQVTPVIEKISTDSLKIIRVLDAHDCYEKDKYSCDDCHSESCHFEPRKTQEQIIKVLELSEGYMRPEGFHRDFVSVKSPLEATFFPEQIQFVPFDVSRAFKDARFKIIIVNWEEFEN